MTEQKNVLHHLDGFIDVLNLVAEGNDSRCEQHKLSDSAMERIADCAKSIEETYAYIAAVVSLLNGHINEEEFHDQLSRQLEEIQREWEGPEDTSFGIDPIVINIRKPE